MLVLFLLALAAPDSEAIATVRAPPAATAEPFQAERPSEEQIEEAVGVGEAAPPPAVAAMLQPKPANVRAAAPAAPASPPEPATTRASLPAPENTGELPTGAPADDYGFIAWCHGALFGHMELYDAVKPELTKLERNKAEAAANAKLDKEQNEAGREYLALYSRALLAAERAAPNGIHERGVAADAQGYKLWAAVRAAEPTTRMWAWLTWELPARCEIAANRLEEKSSLFAETFRRGGKDEAPKPAADDAKDVAKSDAPAEAAQ
ncbi:MAG: hypothetical protein ABIO37_02730 [Caulobacteraceae bacterium]